MQRVTDISPTVTAVRKTYALRILDGPAVEESPWHITLRQSPQRLSALRCRI